MRPLLLFFVAVLGAHSVILDYADQTSVNDEVEWKDDEEQQPVGRTLLFLHLLKKKLARLYQLKQAQPQPLPPFIGCICVQFYLCAPNGTVITDGSGIIDFRQTRPCVNAAEVCCYALIPYPIVPPTIAPPTIPTTPPPVTLPPTIPTTQPPPTLPPTIPTTQPPPTLPTTIPPTQPPPTLPPTIPTTGPPPIDPRQTTMQPAQLCVCLPIFQCAINSGNIVTGVSPTDGSGVINPRQQLASTCIGLYVCCNNVVTQPTVAPTTLPPYPLPTTIPITMPTVPPTTVPPPTVPPTIPTTMGPFLNLNLNCLCMLLTACSLGYMPLTSVSNIDPRQLVPRQGQSCSGDNSVCCQLGSRDLNTQSNALVKFGDETIKNPGSPNACRCVSVDNCPESDTVSYDSDGTIDPRFGPCMSPTLVCCKLQTSNLQRTEVGVSPGSRANVANCGLQDTTFAGVTSATPGTTYFAEYPWMVLLLIRRAGTADTFQCGGSLINSRVVLTAAHCVVRCDPGTLFARVGEWNTAAATEPLPYQDIGVQTVIVHPQFYQAALYHDVALVVLNSPVTYAVNVKPICLTEQGQQFATNSVCYASGWGSSAFGAQGQYQTILRKVALPIVDNDSCQTRLRATRLGQAFQLDSSFICAGGQPNMDTCSKDGGGPLVCQNANGQFTQAGVVSWGIGCGSAIPAVYASVAQHRQWIDQQVSALGILS